MDAPVSYFIWFINNNAMEPTQEHISFQTEIFWFIQLHNGGVTPALRDVDSWSVIQGHLVNHPVYASDILIFVQQFTRRR